MPANLSPEYLAAEKRFRSARTLDEKILALEEMLAVIPKHKGTEKMQADIKRRLSKLRIEGEKRTGRKGLSYSIRREGAGQVLVTGLPNVGKSSLVGRLTNASTIVANYPYTTQKPLPGMMFYENIQIQLVDMPPMAYEPADPWYANMSRTADLIVVMVDLMDAPDTQLELVAEELARFRIRPAGWPGKEGDTYELEKPMLVLGSKADHQETREVLPELRRAASGLPVLAISNETGQGLEAVRTAVFRLLDIIRVYTRAPGKEHDLSHPFVLKRGSTVADLACEIHQDFLEKFKYGRVWGRGKFNGQKVNRDYPLSDGDVVELRI
ncbi:MAG: TGS domain-containing protein [Deltaproteobacteria bacterium]|nr:TGS domain-containing protein [Deltaproteobacteria bacterium]MBW2308288.1 TGS domain-containing protein [Deltaproteobacteria bacterium]